MIYVNNGIQNKRNRSQRKLVENLMSSLDGHFYRKVIYFSNYFKF